MMSQVGRARIQAVKSTRWNPEPRKWFGDDFDLDAVDLTLAAAASERLTGDPLWLLIVGGPGTAKTEMVSALIGARAHVISTIHSEGALLSATKATKAKQATATGGLLRKIGERGVLVIKDVTSILSSSDRNACPRHASVSVTGPRQLASQHQMDLSSRTCFPGKPRGSTSTGDRLRAVAKTPVSELGPDRCPQRLKSRHQFALRSLVIRSGRASPMADGSCPGSWTNARPGCGAARI
jgi:hypothetical protein